MPPSTPTPPTTPTTPDPAPAPAPSLISGEPTPPAPAFGLDPLDAEKLTALLPEGFQLDETLSGKFLEALNSADSRESFAKSMVTLQAEMLQQSEEAANAAWQATQDRWKQEVQTDPEFGGEKLEKVLANTRTVIETHLSPEEAKGLKDFLDLTGAGNSIHFVRLINRLASKIPGEATPVEGTPAATEKSRADRLFSST